MQSNLYIHLDHDTEVIVLKGEGQDVKKAAERRRTLKGVKHVKLNTTSVGKEL
jgi:CopG family transcriptional regulator, nickel-responsive regulator